MPRVSSIFCEDPEYYTNLTAHTQAIERTIQTMHTHLPELLTLEDLASIACLSPFHFNRIFRRLIGIPPGEFLSALRFQMARHLLLTTSLRVTDICFEVGYTSIGSFTSRFTRFVGLSPRLLRQRAHVFEPPLAKPTEFDATASYPIAGKHALLGRISTSSTFVGTIYLGLFAGPIPQGAPIQCSRLSSPGVYLMPDIPDGVYHLRAAAFPVASDLRSALLPGEKMLLGNNASPLRIHDGHVIGNPDLVLHPPRLTDPPLVMGLPLV